MKQRILYFVLVLLLLLLVLMFALAGCGPAGRYESNFADRVARLIPVPKAETTPPDVRDDIFGDSNVVSEGAFRIVSEVTPDIVFLENQSYRETVETEPLAHLFDFAVPAPAAAEDVFPLILFVPGGSWTEVDKTFFRDAVVTMANHGFAAAVINTRTLPDYGYSTQIEDVLDAVNFFASQPEFYHVDPQNVFLVGFSSGGNLALNAAYSAGAGFASEEKAGTWQTGIRAVGTYAAPISANVRDNIAGLAGLGDNTLAQALMEKEGISDPETFLNKIDPITYLTPAAPPTLILQGSADEVVDLSQGEALYAALIDENVPTEIITYARATHEDIPMEKVLKDINRFFKEKMEQEGN
ncbi:MAG: alpha/beta hydrolase [Clostridiales Family XIII bacterium]|jgi:acetyl esterase/lipase|nr:alpha/beta hydrolase [Clostridiales Family XIII bacterium]